MPVSSLLLRSLLLLVFLLSACGKQALPVDSIEITPGSLLLTDSGEEYELSATVRDAQGIVIDKSVTWTSSQPDIVMVSPTGVVTAVGEIGSAQITAEAPGAMPDSMLVLVATPVAGAVLVSDAQILTLPEPEDPFQAGLGSRYRTTLRGIAVPDVGAALLAREEAPLAGRVVSATALGDEVEVVLELRPLQELFERLSFSVQGTISSADVAFDLQGYSQPDQIVRGPDGPTFVYELQEVLPQAESFFNVGPFECVATAGVAPKLTAISITPSSRFDYDYRSEEDSDGNLSLWRFAVTGTIVTKLSGGIKYDAAFNGGLDCRYEIARLPIPMGGPIAAVASPWVPVGGRFGVNGEFALTAFEMNLLGEVKLEGTIGGQYTPASGWTRLTDVSVTSDGDFRVRDITDLEFRVSAAVSAGLYSVIEFGNRFFAAGLLDITAGPVQDVQLTTPLQQMLDPMYSSSYTLKMEAKVAPHRELTAMLELVLGEEAWQTVAATVVRLEFTRFETLASSPTGTIEADRADFVQGEPVAFVVLLAPQFVNYPGFGYNVNETRIYRALRASEGAPPNDAIEIARVSAEPGQTEFELAWTATEDGLVGEDFFAVVVTALMPFAPLEVASTKEGCPTVTGLATLEIAQCVDLVVEADLPSTVEAGVPVALVVRAGYPTEGGGIAYAEGVHVSLSASGGTVVPEMGTTDATGAFHAEVTLATGAQELTVTISADDPAFGTSASTTVSSSAGLCSALLGTPELSERSSGDGVATAQYGRVTAVATDGNALPEASDFLAIIPADPALAGQTGSLRVRWRYRMASEGTSEVNPAARASIYPRKIFESYWTINFSAPVEEPNVVEGETERDIQIRFSNGTSTSPISVRADVFATGGGTIRAESEWLGIVGVTDGSGNPVAVTAICSVSGTNYQ